MGGITKALVDMAEDESVGVALTTAENWGLTLEDMAAVASKGVELKAIGELFNVVRDATDQLLVVKARQKGDGS